MLNNCVLEMGFHNRNVGMSGMLSTREILQLWLFGEMGAVWIIAQNEWAFFVVYKALSET